MEALKKEWLLRSPLLPKAGKLVSIYFGGGTPSLLSPRHIDTILSWISPSKEVEITLEANPDSIRQFKGINRISLGIQSFDPHLLDVLTRTHTADRAKKAVDECARQGIENITIDLMYDLPHQTLSTWEKTLDTALCLPITHLSLYNLTIEPHTSFYRHRKSLATKLPNQETSLEMLELAIDKLEAGGLRRYEISAFAKKNFYSRHNTGYWTGRPFLGFGPSAFSYWQGARFRNEANLNRYAKKLNENIFSPDFYENLSHKEKLKEKLAISLRLIQGVKRWPSELNTARRLLDQNGFLDESRLKLSKKGLLFHDTVAEIIINC